MKRIQFQRSALSAALLATMAALAGCGGGTDTKNQVDLSTSLTITGTVATTVNKVTVPFAGADVVVYCAKGYSHALTNADGTYSVKVSGPGVGPCLLNVFKSDSASPYLRSVAAGSGTANITPITEMLVQEISGQVNTTAQPITQSTNNSLVALPQHPGFQKLMTNPQLLADAINRVTEITKTFPAVSSTAPAYPTGYTPPTNWLTAPLVVPQGAAAGNDQSQFLVALANRGVISATGTLASAPANEAWRQGGLNKITTP